MTAHISGFGTGLVMPPNTTVTPSGAVTHTGRAPAHLAGFGTGLVTPPPPPSPGPVAPSGTSAVQIHESVHVVLTPSVTPWWRRAWLLVTAAGRVGKEVLDLQQRLAAWVQGILFWVGGTWAAVNWRELRDAISRWLFGE